jgi:hypothetical protein
MPRMSKSEDSRRFVVMTFDMEGVTVTSAEVSKAAIELSDNGQFIVEIVSSTTYIRVPYDGPKGLTYPDPVLVVIFERIDLGDPAESTDTTKH